MKGFRSIYCFIMLGYILGVHNGQLALWREPEPEPIHVFPRSAASLPEADQKLLKQGIPLQNLSELTKRLEDYLS